MAEADPTHILPFLIGLAAAVAMTASLVTLRSVRSAQHRSAVRQQLEVATGRRGDLRHGVQLPATVRRWLDSADVQVTSSIPIPILGTVIVCPAALVVTIGFAAALAVILLGCAAVVLTITARQGAADRRYESDLPDSLDHIVRALRSGGSLSRALTEAADRTEHRLGADLAWLGRASPSTTLDERLAQWPDRRPISAVRLVAAALALGHESGSGQSVALEGAAESLRVRLDTHAELRSQSVQSRLSAVVIASSPIGFLGVTALIDARVPQFLLDNMVGRLSLFFGLLLDAIAAATMIRMTARTVE